MTFLVYGVAGWLFLAGCYGLCTSRNLVHAVVSLSIAQSATYILLIGVGYQRGATAPVFSAETKVGTPVVDPVVQSMVLTDIVVSAMVTALLLALAVQIDRRHGTVDPDRLTSLEG
jgi:multicomponent Na+:H+ antiporter subunit C